MKPNIFDFATKELSQDAFLIWLFKWADPINAHYDRNLHLCGQELIKELIKKQTSDFEFKITSVNVTKQYNIDICITINNAYFIIIEDKTNSSYHSNQLARYREKADEICLKNNYKLICIYVKTGNESEQSLNTVEKEGYYIFNRSQFGTFLNKHIEIKNSIFIDFRERLLRIENENNEYTNKEIGKWSGADWQGFFQFLEKELGKIEWKKVNNGSGGFWGAVLVRKNWEIYPIYLQIEEKSLCFKVSIDSCDRYLKSTGYLAVRTTEHLAVVLLRKWH